ncbi:MAG TPA: NAD-dependent epimerase/dehydratase family protein [Gaiellaceae bacterium]|nr:NAD-dependent epimerase/dehydratase family protein [Gaiellaceae bacterium]
MTPVVVVTGCAGFIGSHLSERLVAEGFHVRGVDAFRPYYPRSDKEANLAALAGERRFELLELDLATDALEPVVAGASVVFHLAAQAGVRGSFGSGFAEYVRDNVLATQRVFEAALTAGPRRVVWASSSSVYGDASEYPCREGATPPAPRSPYGVTKHTCEQLAEVYRAQGLEAVGLRYFTVYGPRQRPDMALRRLCEALVDGTPFPLYGDGSQSRDFTHVTDAVEATLLAARATRPAPVYNVGGGEEARLADVISTLESLAGRRAAIERRKAQRGDVRRTGADTSLAGRTLGWRPVVGLRPGLQSQLDWVRQRAEARRIPARKDVLFAPRSRLRKRDGLSV